MVLYTLMLAASMWAGDPLTSSEAPTEPTVAPRPHCCPVTSSEREKSMNTVTTSVPVPQSEPVPVVEISSATSLQPYPSKPGIRWSGGIEIVVSDPSVKPTPDLAVPKMVTDNLRLPKPQERLKGLSVGSFGREWIPNGVRYINPNKPTRQYVVSLKVRERIGNEKQTISAPQLVVSEGQAGRIQTATQRPFVIGTDPDDQTIPVTEVVTCGLDASVIVKPSSDGLAVLDITLNHSDVQDVSVNTLHPQTSTQTVHVVTSGVRRIERVKLGEAVTIPYGGVSSPLEAIVTITEITPEAEVEGPAKYRTHGSPL